MTKECLHCSTPLTKKQVNKQGKNWAKYCGLDCTYAHRSVLREERLRREEQSAKASADALEGWMRQRRKRIARQQGMAA